MPFEVVLVEPEIPQNAGNVARLCAVTGAGFHMVRPLGFHIGDKHMKRAGLDYWDSLSLTLHDSLEAFMEWAAPRGGIWLASTGGHNRYHDVRFSSGDFFLLGAETRGLPRELIARYPERTIRIPMRPEQRSLNLANSASIILYEALRQMQFPGME